MAFVSRCFPDVGCYDGRISLASNSKISRQVIHVARADWSESSKTGFRLMGLIYYRNDLSFRTDRSGQTVQTQIRLLLEEQSDQGLHCLLFHLHHSDKVPYGLASLFEF